MIKTVVHVHRTRASVRDDKAPSEMTTKELKSELKTATGARRVELQREMNRRDDEEFAGEGRLNYQSAGKGRR